MASDISLPHSHIISNMCCHFSRRGKLPIGWIGVMASKTCDCIFFYLSTNYNTFLRFTMSSNYNSLLDVRQGSTNVKVMSHTRLFIAKSSRCCLSNRGGRAFFEGISSGLRRIFHPSTHHIKQVAAIFVDLKTYGRLIGRHGMTKMQKPSLSTNFKTFLWSMVRHN